jgi:hypothetical protein
MNLAIPTPNRLGFATRRLCGFQCQPALRHHPTRGRLKLIISQAGERIARIRAALNGMDCRYSARFLERTKICGKPGCRRAD